MSARDSIEIDGKTLTAGHMAIFDKKGDAVITALEPSTLMLLGGEPVGPRHIWWNFVSSSKDRIEQAKADWKAGRMDLPHRQRQGIHPAPGRRDPTGARDARQRTGATAGRSGIRAQVRSGREGNSRVLIDP